jgi:hypothetical protein
MNGHVSAERFGWLIASLVAIGTAGFATPGPATVISQPVSALHAPTAHPTVAAPLPDWYLTEPARPADSPTGPAEALAADGMAWPSSAPTVTSVATHATHATPVPAPVAKPVVRTVGTNWLSQYRGTNHVWMPTLGINKPVYLFPCSRGRSPDNFVYRWGCAGANNVYLLGHAYGVFKPLHDAYYNGRLKIGMPVVYADGAGHIHLFRVTTWRIANPVDVAWAYSAQPVSSMTLQTCIGATSQYRLNVRLIEVKA